MRVLILSRNHPRVVNGYAYLPPSQPFGHALLIVNSVRGHEVICDFKVLIFQVENFSSDQGIRTPDLLVVEPEQRPLDHSDPQNQRYYFFSLLYESNYRKLQDYKKTFLFRRWALYLVTRKYKLKKVSLKRNKVILKKND